MGRGYRREDVHMKSSVRLFTVATIALLALRVPTLRAERHRRSVCGTLS